VAVDEDAWRQAVLGMAAGEATLLGLWSDGEAVHLGLIGEAGTELLVISLPCPSRRFPSVARTHLPALRLERTVRDLYGLEPEGTPDVRPWLDHGRWGVRMPLGKREPTAATGATYRFHRAEGPLHQIGEPCVPAS
jgi:Ni,Fe-hydrogenase III component G